MGYSDGGTFSWVEPVLSRGYFDKNVLLKDTLHSVSAEARTGGTSQSGVKHLITTEPLYSWCNKPLKI